MELTHLTSSDTHLCNRAQTRRTGGLIGRLGGCLCCWGRGAAPAAAIRFGVLSVGEALMSWACENAGCWWLSRAKRAGRRGGARRGKAGGGQGRVHQPSAKKSQACGSGEGRVAGNTICVFVHETHFNMKSFSWARQGEQ